MCAHTYIEAYIYKYICFANFLQQIFFLTAFIIVHCKMIKKFKFKVRIKRPFHLVALLLLWILKYSYSHKYWTDIGSKASCLIITLFCPLYSAFPLFLMNQLVAIPLSFTFYSNFIFSALEFSATSIQVS